MDWSLPKKRTHISPLRPTATRLEIRTGRAGQPVLGEYRCGVHREVYRYARSGEVSGVCSVKAAPGKSVQPHEYMLCPACSPRAAICLTHSPYYGDADRHFQQEEERHA